MMDFEKLVACEREYFLTQATKPYVFRMEQLKKLMNWIDANEQDILSASSNTNRSTTSLFLPLYTL